MNAKLFGDYMKAANQKPVRKEIKSVFELQSVTIPAGGEIELHSHKGEWDTWFVPSTMEAFICPSGGEHSLRNERESEVTIMAIKGKGKCSYNELKEFFENIGFKVKKGSILFKD